MDTLIILSKGGKSMKENVSSFSEEICGVKYIVNERSSENAKLTTEEYLKALITKESMELEEECA